MIWVDREAKKIAERKLPLEWVDDMKTPSGRIHVGSLRGVVIHDLMYKALDELGVDTKFSYVFEDHDPMDGLPSYLDAKKWEKYMGMQLYKVPSPEKGFKSFAEYYALEFQKVFESINCHPEIIWGSQLYLSGKMNGVIKEALDNADKVRAVYKKIAKVTLKDDWFPFQVNCENCGKIGTTTVFAWVGTLVSYRCEKNKVKWAVGCGHEGAISPFDGNGKMPWKVEWPAKWKVIGVTVEGAGKDHMSSGGSHDMAEELCKTVFKYPVPHPLPYEFFIVGGKKMSSSKGIGSSAKEVSEILPPEIFRFLLVRTPIERTLDFDPYGDSLPNLFDDYDRCLNAHFDRLEGKLPDGKEGEVLEDFARIAELSEVRPLPQKRIFLPRFRTIINLTKTQTDILKYCEQQKGSPLNDDEKEVLEERIIFAEVWLKDYAGADEKIEMTKDLPTDLTDTQKGFLRKLADTLASVAKDDREELQNAVFDTLKKNNFQAREVFPAFYRTILGRPAGPKVADLILEFGKDKIIEQLNAVQNNEKKSSQTSMAAFPDLEDARLFSIDKELSKKYPSISIGVAVIKNVKIGKTGKALQTLLDQFVQENQSLTNEVISSYPEVKAYRNLYKETGIDWHSRRPSPEALLRRVALKKDLYSINSCVDAYNLIVMKNRVSIGAFDYDKVEFPTVLRFSKQGEEILLLGDKEPTKYKSGEIAYFDKKGGYNIDFNFRDAQRTAVTDKTTKILINIDGVFEISRSKVEQSLKETLDIITKYCGGEVELAGIVEASA